MSTLLIVVGVVWAIIGVANILGMPWNKIDPASPLATFGLMFNMLLFVLPGLVVAGIGTAIGKRKREQQTDQLPAVEIESATRKCPFCAEAIKAEAVVCRFCGRDLPRNAAVDAAVDAAAEQDHQFEDWLASQNPPLVNLSPAERASCRQAFDYNRSQDAVSTAPAPGAADRVGFNGAKAVLILFGLMLFFGTARRFLG